MPLYEELIRRALATSERAEDLRQDSRRVRKLAQLLRDAHAGRVLLVHCAWCERLQVDKEWLRLADIGGNVEIGDSLIRRSSHGICPDCFQKVSRQLDAAAKRARKPSASAPEHRRLNHRTQTPPGPEA